MAMEQEDDYTEDRISMLPNDILGLINNVVVELERSYGDKHTFFSMAILVDLHIRTRPAHRLDRTLQKHTDHDNDTLIGMYVKWVGRSSPHHTAPQTLDQS
ncbi:hypothetical protein AAHA92_32388 [Salvia divinorum]|uniref:Uncharacterized protein n=1 Tax=Salvia divinorum TaxID=28513 RepID=A0ABD1FLJ8_SALDI